MKNILIIGVIVILIILAGWFVVTQDEPRDQRDDTENGTTTEPVLGDPDDWQTYESTALTNDLGFTLRHPQEVTADTPTQDIVSFKYIGPESEPNTEITDGFTFTVQLEEIDASATLESYASDRRMIQEATITNTRFTDREAVRFVTTSELDNSDIPHIAVRLNNTTVATISYIISGDTDDRYQNTVNRMLDSLTFSERETDENGAPVFRQVSLAMLTDGGSDPERGCDDVVMTSVSIEPTIAPLTAALTRLFAIEEETFEGNRNFIARTHDTLMFDRAVVEDGIAHIYLTGELSGLAGVCDNPRAAIQIEETALQFATVNDVQLYLDGEETDLTPDERDE